MNISNCYVYENGRQCQRIVAVTRAAQVGCAATTVRVSGSEKIRVCLGFLREQIASGLYALHAAG